MFILIRIPRVCANFRYKSSAAVAKVNCSAEPKTIQRQKQQKQEVDSARLVMSCEQMLQFPAKATAGRLSGMAVSDPYVFTEPPSIQTLQVGVHINWTNKLAANTITVLF